MGEDELGMNLFLGDDFFEEEENLDNKDDKNNDVDGKSTDDKNIDDAIEDESPEGVDGDNTEDDTSDDDSDDDMSSPPLYKSLASVLHEQGVLTSVDSSDLEKVESVQDLADLITKEVKSKELADLTDLQKEAVEAFRNGVDPEFFTRQKTVENQLDSITEEILLEDQDLRRQIIYQDFINQGFSQEKANRLTERSISADDDIEDAKEALESIKSNLKDSYNKELENKKLEASKQEKEYKDRQEKLKNKILKSEEIIPGFKVNEVIKKQVYKNMIEPVGKNPVTGNDENSLMKEQRENPEDFSAKLYFVYTATKGFTDFSFFGKKEKNKAINDLERALKNNQHVITGGDPSFLDDSDSSDFVVGDKLSY
jgi:hypothetical protein